MLFIEYSGFKIVCYDSLTLNGIYLPHLDSSSNPKRGIGLLAPNNIAVNGQAGRPYKYDSVDEAMQDVDALIKIGITSTCGGAVDLRHLRCVERAAVPSTSPVPVHKESRAMIRLSVELTDDEYDFLIDMFAKTQNDVECHLSSHILGPMASRAARFLEDMRKRLHDKIVDAKNADFRTANACCPPPAPARSTVPVSCVASGDDAPAIF